MRPVELPPLRVTWTNGPTSGNGTYSHTTANNLPEGWSAMVCRAPGEGWQAAITTPGGGTTRWPETPDGRGESACKQWVRRTLNNHLKEN